MTRGGNPWTPASVRRILTSPTYTGTLCYAKRGHRSSRLVSQDEEDWIVAEGAWEAIVEQSDFDEVQAELNDGSRRRAWCEKSTYLLTGLVRCGRCGGRMNGWTQRGDDGEVLYSYYRCTTRTQKGKAVCEGLSCRRFELEAAIVDHVIGFDAPTLRRAIEEWQARAAAEAAPRHRRHQELEAQFAAYGERERRLLELYEEAVIDIDLFRERRGQLERERLAIAQELAELGADPSGDDVEALDADALVAQFQELQATFPHLSAREQRRLLQAMVREITVQPDGTVQVDFNLIAGLAAGDVPLDEYREFDLRADDEPEDVGGQLRQYRAARGLTQKALAARLGVRQYTLCQWESGRTSPSPRSRALIERATGIKVMGNGNGRKPKAATP